MTESTNDLLTELRARIECGTLSSPAIEARGDVVFARDFLRYFFHFAPLLRTERSLGCVSAASALSGASLASDARQVYRRVWGDPGAAAVCAREGDILYPEVARVAVRGAPAPFGRVLISGPAAVPFAVPEEFSLTAYEAKLFGDAFNAQAAPLRDLTGMVKRAFREDPSDETKEAPYMAVLAARASEGPELQGLVYKGLLALPWRRSRLLVVHEDSPLRVGNTPPLPALPWTELLQVPPRAGVERAAGEGCDSACLAANGYCLDADLALVNTCGALEAAFGCDCDEAPAETGPHYDRRSHRCAPGVAAPRCVAVPPPHVTRLCVCRPLSLPMLVEPKWDPVAATDPPEPLVTTTPRPQIVGPTAPPAPDAPTPAAAGPSARPGQVPPMRRQLVLPGQVSTAYFANPFAHLPRLPKLNYMLHYPAGATPEEFLRTLADVRGLDGFSAAQLYLLPSSPHDLPPASSYSSGASPSALMSALHPLVAAGAVTLPPTADGAALSAAVKGLDLSAGLVLVSAGARVSPGAPSFAAQLLPLLEADLSLWGGRLDSPLPSVFAADLTNVYRSDACAPVGGFRVGLLLAGRGPLLLTVLSLLAAPSAADRNALSAAFLRKTSSCVFPEVARVAFNCDQCLLADRPIHLGPLSRLTSEGMETTFHRVLATSSPVRAADLSPSSPSPQRLHFATSHQAVVEAWLGFKLLLFKSAAFLRYGQSFLVLLFASPLISGRPTHPQGLPPLLPIPTNGALLTGNVCTAACAAGGLSCLDSDQVISCAAVRTPFACQVCTQGPQLSITNSSSCAGPEAGFAGSCSARARPGAAQICVCRPRFGSWGPATEKPLAKDFPEILDAPVERRKFRPRPAPARAPAVADAEPPAAFDLLTVSPSAHPANIFLDRVRSLPPHALLAASAFADPREDFALAAEPADLRVLLLGAAVHPERTLVAFRQLRRLFPEPFSICVAADSVDAALREELRDVAFVDAVAVPLSGYRTKDYWHLLKFGLFVTLQRHFREAAPRSILVVDATRDFLAFQPDALSFLLQLEPLLHADPHLVAVALEGPLPPQAFAADPTAVLRSDVAPSAEPRAMVLRTGAQNAFAYAWPKPPANQWLWPEVPRVTAVPRFSPLPSAAAAAPGLHGLGFRFPLSQEAASLGDLTRLLEAEFDRTLVQWPGGLGRPPAGLAAASPVAFTDLDALCIETADASSGKAGPCPGAAVLDYPATIAGQLAARLGLEPQESPPAAGPNLRGERPAAAATPPVLLPGSWKGTLRVRWRQTNLFLRAAAAAAAAPTIGFQLPLPSFSRVAEGETGASCTDTCEARWPESVALGPDQSLLTCQTLAGLCPMCEEGQPSEVLPAREEASGVCFVRPASAVPEAERGKALPLQMDVPAAPGATGTGYRRLCVCRGAADPIRPQGLAASAADGVEDHRCGAFAHGRLSEKCVAEENYCCSGEGWCGASSGHCAAHCVSSPDVFCGRGWWVRPYVPVQ